MPDELLMFTLWIRNDVTKESTQVKGQGKSVPEAFKEGWENANEDFGKSSSGAPPISRAHLAVRLPDGRTVFRKPSAFASREPYDAAKEAKEFAAPIATGDAAKAFAQLVDEGKATYAKPKPAK